MDAATGIFLKRPTNPRLSVLRFCSIHRTVCGLTAAAAALRRLVSDVNRFEDPHI